MTSSTHNYRPTELIRLINKSGFGTVLTESRLKVHRGRDVNSSDFRTVDLAKYAAWLTEEFFREADGPLDYQEKKRRQAEKNAETVRTGQDIGVIPEVDDPDRKKAALQSFRIFCETYFSEVFYLKWSEDHLRVIEKIERAVVQGALCAIAMPRGSGKALALDTPVLTPLGWSTMGGLKVGDEVFDEGGVSRRIVFATEVQYGRECFRSRIIVRNGAIGSVSTGESRTFRASGRSGTC